MRTEGKRKNVKNHIDLNKKDWIKIYTLKKNTKKDFTPSVLSKVILWQWHDCIAEGLDQADLLSNYHIYSSKNQLLSVKLLNYIRIIYSKVCI